MVDVEKNNKFNAIKNNIFRLAYILREVTDNYRVTHIIILLISAHRNNLIKYDLIYNSFEDLFKDEIKSIPIYQKFFEYINPQYLKLSDKNYLEIIQCLANIDTTILNEFYSEIFEWCLYDLSKSHFNFQAIRLTKFIQGLAKPKENESIYNPFASIATFSILNKESNYLGQEIDYGVWLLGQLRLKNFNVDTSHQYLNQDSIKCWPNQKFDYILTISPFIRLEKIEIKEFDLKIRNFYEFAIYKSIQSLKDNGEAYILVPDGFLSSNTSKRLRELLLKDNVLDKVISLPSGVLVYSGTKTSLIVLKQNRECNAPIECFDLSNVYELKQKQKVFDFQRALDIINTNKSENYISVKPNEISDYILVVGKLMLSKSNRTPE